MKRKLKALFGVLLAMIMTVCCLSISVFAADYGTETGIKLTKSDDIKKVRGYYVGKFDATGKSVVVGDKVGDSQTNKPVLDASYKIFQLNTLGSSSSTMTIQYDKTAYDALTTDTQRKAVQEMIATISAWGLSSGTVSSIASTLANSDKFPYTQADAVSALFNQGADIQGAMTWFAPFQGAVGLILGIGVIAIMVLLLASTVLDLVYIGLPTARMAMTSKAQQGGEDKTPFGISSDALRIVREKNENGESGNPYLKYFKSRLLTYIILAVCILYLVSGQLGGLIGGLLDMVSGIGG